MTSYQTSAIASSDEEEDEQVVPDSIGLVIISPTPLDDYACSDDDDDKTLPTHPLYDQSVWWPVPCIRAHCHVTSTPREYDPESLHALCAVALDLVDRGACVIVTGTGFSSMQRDLATRLPVPIICSAMIQISSLRLVSTGPVGVVTLDRQLLSSWNLVAVGAPPDVPVIGLDPASLWRRTRDAQASPTLVRELLDACRALMTRHGVTSIVLEEPRFAPFTRQLQDVLRDVRLFDVVTAVNWVYAGHRAHAPRARESPDP